MAIKNTFSQNPVFKNTEIKSLEPFCWRMGFAEVVAWAPFPLGVLLLPMLLAFMRGCCYSTDLSVDLMTCITLH